MKDQKDLPLPQTDLPLPEKEIPAGPEAIEVSKNKWTLFIIIGLAILFVTLIGGYLLAAKNAIRPIACTLEAKICPDGSSVGRAGPKCEFAKCPEANSTHIDTSNWKTYTDNKTFTLMYPPLWTPKPTRGLGVDFGSFSLHLGFDSNIYSDYPQSGLLYSKTINNIPWQLYRTGPSSVPYNNTTIFGSQEKMIAMVLTSIENFDDNSINSKILSTIKFINPNQGNKIIKDLAPDISSSSGHFSIDDVIGNYASGGFSGEGAGYAFWAVLTNGKWKMFYQGNGSIPYCSQYKSYAVPKQWCSCTPRPACLDSKPRCMIAETADMCPPTITPTQ